MLTFVVWIWLTVYASVPLHAVYASVPLREQTCVTTKRNKCELYSPQLPRELLADGKQHGQIDVCQWQLQSTYKVRNFREMFSFSQKEKQDDCFFLLLNKRNLLERELSTQYSERKRFVPNQSLETWFVKGFSKRRTIVIKPWSNVLQSFTKIIFRTILFECAFYSIHIFKSRLEGVSFYGNLLLFMDKSGRFDWICEFRHSLSWVGRQGSKPLCSQLC
jgi:hypothetical protein